MGWPGGRDLILGEAGVRAVHHADVPVRPRLRCRPLDSVVAVLVGARTVVTHGHKLAFGCIRAPHVLAYDGIPTLRVIRTIGAHSSAQLVGDAFDDNWKASTGGWTIDVRTQDRAIAHGHRHLVLNFDLEFGLAGVRHHGGDRHWTSWLLAPTTILRPDRLCRP